MDLVRRRNIAKPKPKRDASLFGNVLPAVKPRGPVGLVTRQQAERVVKGETVEIVVPVSVFVDPDEATVCIACGGTRKNSKGGDCVPCKNRKAASQAASVVSEGSCPFDAASDQPEVSAVDTVQPSLPAPVKQPSQPRPAIKAKKGGMRRPISMNDPKMQKSVQIKKDQETAETIARLTALAEANGMPIDQTQFVPAKGSRPAFMRPIGDGKPVDGCSEYALPVSEAYNRELEQWADKALITAKEGPEREIAVEDLFNEIRELEAKTEEPKPQPKPVNRPVAPRPQPPEVRPNNFPMKGKPVGETPNFMRVSKKGGDGCHILVNALAGTGKTFTVIEGCRRLRGQPTPGVKGSDAQEDIWKAMQTGPVPQTIHMTAFNRSIAKKLQEEVPAGVTASTAHSFGLKAIKQSGMKAKVDDRKTNFILAEGWDADHFRNFPGLCSVAEQCVGLIKGNLLDWTFETQTAEETVAWLFGKYGITTTDENTMALIEVLPYLMSEHYHNTNIIDYTDMIWFPNVHPEIRIQKYDLLIVDEAQDMNKAQQGLVMMSARRTVLVGDRNQAIYGFAGADEESMDHMKERLEKDALGINELPLFETRRCCQAVVELAQELVPELRAMPNAPLGKVTWNKEEDGMGHVGPNDLVVCRTNAPIIRECLRMLRDSKKARMQGRDIGEDLVRMIKKLAGDDNRAEHLLDALDFYYYKEAEKLSKRRFGSESAMMILEDKVESIKAFSQGAIAVTDIVNRIEKLFDDKTTEGTLFSSIHRAKGLEAEQVIFFQQDQCPHPMAKTESAQKQERNLRYVGETRAKNSLYMTRSKPKKPAVSTEGDW